LNSFFFSIYLLSYPYTPNIWYIFISLFLLNCIKRLYSGHLRHLLANFKLLKINLMTKLLLSE